MIYLIDKFIMFLFGKYTTDYKSFTKTELELELIDVKKVRFIPGFKNGYWLEGTYLLLAAIIIIHLYKYFTENDNALILKSFVCSIIGLIFYRLMLMLDKNIRIYRIIKQLKA